MADRSEVKQVIERIEHLLVTNEFSDQVYDLRDGDTKTVRNLLAYSKVDVEGNTEEFWVPPTVFDKEFVFGVNKVGLMKELQRLGWLLPSSSDGRPTLERRANGKKSRYFVFSPKWKKGVETLETATVYCLHRILLQWRQQSYLESKAARELPSPVSSVSTLKTHF